MIKHDVLHRRVASISSSGAIVAGVRGGATSSPRLIRQVSDDEPPPTPHVPSNAIVDKSAAFHSEATHYIGSQAHVPLFWSMLLRSTNCHAH
jgi:hypothetical protein